MKIFPERERFMELAGQGNMVPVYCDLMADLETPVSVYARLHAASGAAFLLESIEGGTVVNRYSFIGCQPRKIIEARVGAMTTITNRIGEVESFPTPADPLEVIEKEMSGCKAVRLPDMPRFVGGAVGFISYEYMSCIEPSVPRPEKDPEQMPVLHFMIADTLVIFDRLRQTLRLLINADVSRDACPDTAYDRACEGLERLVTLLRSPRKVQPAPVVEVQAPARLPGNMEKAEFEGMVERVKEYIRAGDVIQVVGSQRFERPFDKSPLDLYRALRLVNPSPYMFLYDTGSFALVGASPEVHVRLSDGTAVMRPIAGTRPRSADVEKDIAYEKDMLADEKEKAEHLMLVDLARNDLGRVCKPGTVTVPEFMIVERYSHVMHIVSQVEGEISEKHNACDLMRATFPAGTVSGAPKIRAMQIIAEQEKEQRGPYAGAVTYFSYDGNLDSCIAIRTALIKDGRIYVQSGAGLVADSVPESEYQETLNKAGAMFKAVTLAESISPA
ncbi:MAG: anthranilate synthase component I [Opitutales bacterium]|nr:anthranilate synthase component I [Opitutales bacterium]